MTIAAAQSKVDEWIKGIGKGYFGELTNMAILTEEVGELSRHVARIYGDQNYREEPQPSAKECMTDEMADVLWVLLCLANQTGVNLTDAFEKSMEKKTKRDANRHSLRNRK
jgi:NTP pyrophosphatase (non-canonical NTP hydrolase)